MNPLRIAMLAPFGIRPKGTLSARMLPLAKALTRSGHRVSIYAPPVQNPEDSGRREWFDGVLVAHTSAPSLPGPFGVAQQVGSLLWPVLHERPDVLHLFKPKGYSGLAALLARAARPALPLVVDTDDWEGWGGWNDLLPYPQAAKRMFAWQERDLPRRAAAVTVASRTLETQVWGFGVPPECVIYLPNGSSPAAFVPAAARRAEPTILLYTRFWEFDVREVIVALVGILARMSEARLLVVGKGERGEERELLRLAERAGVAHAIDYHGWAEPANIPALLRSADLALVPLDDTLINRARSLAKLLELMSAGLPIVAGRVGQVGEYLEHGVSGWLVAPGDGGALAGGVLRVLADEALRQALGAGAQAAAERLSWERLASDAERAYTIALAASHPHPPSR